MQEPLERLREATQDMESATAIMQQVAEDPTMEGFLIFMGCSIGIIGGIVGSAFLIEWMTSNHKWQPLGRWMLGWYAWEDAYVKRCKTSTIGISHAGCTHADRMEQRWAAKFKERLPVSRTIRQDAESVARVPTDAKLPPWRTR